MRTGGITLKIFTNKYLVGVAKGEIFTYGSTIYLPAQSNDILIMDGENSPDSQSSYYMSKDSYVSNIEIYGTCCISIGKNALNAERDFSATVLAPVTLDLNGNTVKILYINACMNGAVIKNVVASDYAFNVGMGAQVKNITVRGKVKDFEGVPNGIATSASISNLMFVSPNTSARPDVMVVKITPKK